jgi:hypothetical protein
MDRREFNKALIGAGAMLAATPVARSASAATQKSVEDVPVILKCAINGSTTKAKNPTVPETVKTGDPISIQEDGTVVVG